MSTTSTSTIYGRRKLKEEAEAELFQQPTVEAALEHLLNTKPAYLYNDGGDLWIDEKHVDAKVAEILLRFKVDSFPDRAERLIYLKSVLKQKWANKPDIYKSMMTFLIEMSNQPTKNLELKVSDRIYSTAIEDENDNVELVLHGEELRQAELKKEEFRKEVVEDLLETRVEIIYSSDEELSDWSSSSDEEEENQNVVNTCTPTPVVVAITTQEISEPSEEEKKEIVTKYWDNQREKGVFYLSRYQDSKPAAVRQLTDQPVISSLRTFYSRFGEYWEWKKASSMNQRPTKKLIAEKDIIRELIWQFTSPNCQPSSIFTSEWSFHPEIIVQSLCHSSLASFMTPYGQILSKLSDLKQFIQNCSEVNSYPSIFHTYAYALSQVLTFITREFANIERCLKEATFTTQSSMVRPPTTLIQFHRIVEPILDLISSLEYLHSQAICFTESVPNWIKALKLISCLEIHLSLDTRPQMYGLVLYIFSKCLLGALDLILKPLVSMDWENNNFLFSKSSIGITDPNFWNEIITTQPIAEEFKKINLQPLSCLQWLLPKTLTTLKLQEIMNQLNPANGFSPANVAPPLPSYQEIVKTFLERLLDGTLPLHGLNKVQTPTKSVSTFREDYELHLHFLGLKDSIISQAFRNLVEDDSEENSQDELQENRKSDLNSSFSEIEYFYNFTNVPILQIRHPLGRVIEETFEPYFRFGDALLRDIFQRYALREAVPLLQEIIFGGKEEFALACIQLAYDTRIDELRNGHHPIDDEDPNTKFQNLLNIFYPEGRSTFEIEFIFESKSATNFYLKIQPLFPLTLLLTPRTIAHYLRVAMEVFKIRKGLWLLNRLNLKDCKAGIGVEINRVLLVKFSILQFWSSLRCFVLSNTFHTSEGSNCSFDETTDINEMLKWYESQSSGPLYHILSFKMVDAFIIKPMLHSSMILSKNWKTGISLIELMKLSARVRGAWQMILELGGGDYLPEMNHMSQFFGPVPSIF